MEQLTNDQIAEIKAVAKKDFDKSSEQLEFCYHKFTGDSVCRELTGFDSKRNIVKDDILIIMSMAYKVSSIEYRVSRPRRYIQRPRIKKRNFLPSKYTVSRQFILVWR